VPQFVDRALRRSDVVGTRDFHRRGLEDVLRLWLFVPGEEGLRRIDFSTVRSGGLTDRDVRILELLAPHLIRLYGRAARRRTTMPGLEDLTPREREVIGLVADGKTNPEIARQLWISRGTVRTHLENIFEKLDVPNRTAAAARVLRTPSNGDDGKSSAAMP
jgi:DNA-binding CsgD family transcriptional regulator